MVDSIEYLFAFQNVPFPTFSLKDLLMSKPPLTAEYCKQHLPAHTPESFGRAFTDRAIRQAAEMCNAGGGANGSVEYQCTVKISAVPASDCISICVTHPDGSTECYHHWTLQQLLTKLGAGS